MKLEEGATLFAIGLLSLVAFVYTRDCSWLGVGVIVYMFVVGLFILKSPKEE